MKSCKYQERFYRDWQKSKDLYSQEVIVAQSDIQVFSDKRLEKKILEKKINFYRSQINNYISKEPKFLNSLEPLEVEINSPSIIKKMAESSKQAGVGPMASVAGAIAEFLGNDLLKTGVKELIIENGGDIFLKSSRMRKIGIFSGRSTSWKGLVINIKGQGAPLGICASSGTIGHSLSFGRADSAVIIAKSAILADAVATASCNRIKSEKDLKRALDFAKSFQDVLGAVFIMGKKLASWGMFEFSIF